ncbi:tRNA pseudouridine(13) synthase TruD, partial [Candidatus Woesearchaeota archaeon]|nr:tRNA pseudouridine(13) synthase TruD [Candidatus Woesearchaeota archaeon]
YVGAIRILHVPLLKMYLHAFQSRLWNEILMRYIEDTTDSIVRVKYSLGVLAFPGINDNIENKSVPLPGFGDDCEDKAMEKYLADILKMNSLTPFDYVIKQLPNLSLEGAERPAFMEVKEFSVGEFEEDELNEGKKKATISFSLGKGSYATMLVKTLFSKIL